MKKTPSNWKFIGINVLLAVAIVIVILIVVVIWLSHYTEHGKEVEVPQITGLYRQEAESLLGGSGLKLDVIDSTFSKKVPLGTIVEQNPPAEAHVKSGRTIYVVINASAVRQVVLPELHDVSSRQAETALRQLGLEIGETEYEPSEYRDLILDLRVGDRSLEAGDKVPEGTVITMVVGYGKGTEMVTVPNTTGLKLIEARSLLLASHLTVGQVEYDQEPTEENKEEYIVYMQSPQSEQTLLEGSSVHLKLSLDREKAVTSDNVEDEENFF